MWDQSKLGRIIMLDERDKNFPLQSALVETEEVPDYRYWWTKGWQGDQGRTPQCVAYAWLHWLEDGPVTHTPKTPGEGPVLYPPWLYKEAQKRDAWPGEDYAGTSVRAGAKVLQERGLIESYYWAHDLETTINALLTTGPVVVGTYWFSDMFEPVEKDDKHWIAVGGSRVGGHAYVLNGVNPEKGYVRLKNSWGPEWGDGGSAYMEFEDLEKLINLHGEVCLANEIGS